MESTRIDALLFIVKFLMVFGTGIENFGLRIIICCHMVGE